MKVVINILGLLWISQTASAGVIYGTDHIQDNYKTVHYPAYVQIGSFSTAHAAQQLQHQMRGAIIVPSNGRYNVRIGPFVNQASLNAFVDTKSKHIPRSQLIRQPQQHTASHGLSTYSPTQRSHPELSVFLGVSHIPNTLDGQTLQLLPYETGQYADTFTNQSSANAFTWGVDALYRVKLHTPSSQHYFFDSIGAGIDFFQTTNFHQTGRVLQFNMPEFENYTYTLKLNNLRIIANFDVDMHPIQQALIPFIQAGVGSARTTVSYNSVPIAPVEGPDLTLPSQTSWNVAYQAGAGVKYVANTHLIVSLRYLYANMGNVNTSTSGSTATLATPLTVNMNSQNVLFGLTYKVI